MNNLFVFLEIDNAEVKEISLELLTKGRELCQELGCQLEAVALTDEASKITPTVALYGVNKLHIFEDLRLKYYTTRPFGKVIVQLFEKEKPQIALLGATTIGRDLGPYVSSALHSGLTADCTELRIGEYTDPKTKKHHDKLLYQIRPAFGGNIVATIVNPDHRPQMATVRSGVMKKAKAEGFTPSSMEVVHHRVSDYLTDADFLVEIVKREISKSTVDLNSKPIIIAGGYGMGSAENFEMLFDLAELLGAEVGASRAAVDAGYAEHCRQIGQTGTTVRPKLYIACGISGQIQHIAGMQESAMIISINSDPQAPINALADYVITGRVEVVIPQFIDLYKKAGK